MTIQVWKHGNWAVLALMASAANGGAVEVVSRSLTGTVVETADDRVLIDTPSGRYELKSVDSDRALVRELSRGDRISGRITLEKMDLHDDSTRQMPGRAAPETAPTAQPVPGVMDDRGFYSA